VIKPAFIKTYDSLVPLKKKKKRKPIKKIIKFLLIKKKAREGEGALMEESKMAH